ncbi:tetrahydromethanopterin S-methyltransferase subunit B [Methanolobus sp. ZRKC3]|uniref:tetrahydromethanopterin S-methyltransferase subunit B n=1 Tax=Methanolobus sp. ZRKC3 TaxID=3125786 RepID=UPI003247583F
MSMVHVVPEANLVLDPLTGLLAQERDDIIAYSMDPVMAQLDELDKIADDLVNSLSPDKPLLNSYPGRETTALSAGFYGNSFYGIIVGLGVAGLMLLVMGALGVM